MKKGNNVVINGNSETIKEQRLLIDLKFSEARLRQMFQSSPAGIFYYDKNLIITELNSAFADILSAPYSRLKGFDINSVVDKGIIPCIKSALSGKRGSYLNWYQATISGKLIYASLKTYPLYGPDDEKKIIGGTGLVENLTDWKIAQELLEEKEENLRVTLNSIGESVIVTDRNMLVTYLNTVAEHKIGWKNKKAIGRPVHEIINFLDSRNGAAIPDPVRIAIKNRKVISSAKHISVKISTGEAFQVGFSVAPILKSNMDVIGSVIVFQDISESYRIQNELFESESRFHSLFDNSPTGIALIDNNGNVVEVNNVMLSILGSPSAELTKRINVLKYEPLSSAGFGEDFHKCIKRKRSVSRTADYTTFWGKKIVVQYTLSPFIEKRRKISGVILNLLDVTSQKKAEEKERKHFKSLELLAKSAMELVELPYDADIFHFIGLKLSLFNEENTVVINKFDKNTGEYVIEHIFAKKDKLEEFKSITKQNPAELPLNNNARLHIPNKVVEIEKKNFFEAVISNLSPEFLKLMERQSVNKTYLYGLYSEKEFYGSIVIITYDNNFLDNIDVLETFLNQASLHIQRHKAIKDLREAENLYNTTLNSVTEFIHVTDINLNIIFANDTLKSIIREMDISDNIEGMHLNRAIPFLRKDVYEAYETVIKSKKPRFSEETNVVNGKTYHTQTIITPILEEEKVKMLVTSVRDVTQNKLSEKEIASLKGLNESIIQNMNEGIFMEDNNGKVVMANPFFCTIINKTKEWVKGKSSMSLIPKDMREKVKFARLNLSAYKKQTYEIEFSSAGNKKVTTLLSFVPIYQNKELVNLVYVFTDISRRKSTEIDLVTAKEKAEESENKFRTIFETANDGILTADAETMELIFVNPQICRLTGYSYKELLKMDMYSLYPQNKLGYVVNQFEKQKKKEINIAENIPVLKKNGEIVYCDINFSPMEISGRKYILGFFRDITNRLKIEDELLKSKEKAEESDRLKSAFLASMSHELRTPINGIIGFSGLLSNSNITQEQKERYISQIDASSSMLLRLIEDIIDIAKIEAGKLVIEKSGCRVSGILDELNQYYRRELKARKKENILLINNSRISNDLTVFTDPFRLKQVLTNLLSNAVKYTEKGKIEFGCDLDKNSILKFYVKDTGIGIKEENLDKIFERFLQLEITHSRKFGGTGLGLTISKNIIGMLDGEIWVESVYGKGSTFYFTLPVEVLETFIDISEEEPDSTIVYDWNDKTILIAEDDDMNFMFLEEMLISTKAKLIRARNGIEAVELVKKIPEISLILMDIQMPEMDGYESTRIIKSIRRDVVVIAQTAYALTSEKELSYKAGCSEYVTKPINMERLLSILSRYL